MSSAAVLTDNCYGKSKVRVLKLQRETPQHDFVDLDVEVLLRGNGMENAYYSEDNSRIVPTDTVKQTVYYLASKHPLSPIEKFGVIIGKHFLAKYSWVSDVHVQILQNLWQRMTPFGKPSSQGFVQMPGKRVARVHATRSAITVHAGIQDLVLLKTGGSGFVGFNKCDLTILPEAGDRMMTTNATVTWRYEREPADYNATFDNIRDILLEKFTDHYSPSLQFTLHRMVCELADCWLI